MSDERRYVRLSWAAKVAATPTRKTFDEVPGEAEADTVRDALDPLPPASPRRSPVPIARCAARRQPVAVRAR
jgi:hypothetical protein